MLFNLGGNSNTLLTCEQRLIFLKINVKFAYPVDVLKCLKQIKLENFTLRVHPELGKPQKTVFF